MNTIGLLCTAVAFGCAAGLLRAVLGFRVARDAKPAEDGKPLVVVDEELGEYVAELQPVIDAAKERREAAEGRATTLRLKYDAAAVEAEGAGRHRQDTSEATAEVSA